MIYVKLILLIVSMVLVAIALYNGYKGLKTMFNLSEKQFKKRILQIVFILPFLFSTKYLIYFFTPLNNDIGIEFNQERLKRGIDPITESWKLNKEDSSKYRYYWWNSNTENKHFKKWIGLGKIGPRFEYDYYHNPKFKGTFVISTYNYSKKEFLYRYYTTKNKAEQKIKTVPLKELWPADGYIITMSEFEKYLIE